MNRYRAPTIRERGGLRVYLTSLGVDYDLFKTLRDLNGQTNSSIAKSLSTGREKAFRASTIAHWKRIDDNEMEETHHAKG